MAQAPSKIRNILATTDFSPESLAGVRYAVAVAKKLSASVTLLHVFEPPMPMAGMEAVGFAREKWRVAKLAGLQLKRLAKRAGGDRMVLTSFVRTGKPFHEITMAARERAADCIVIATHGYTGAKRLLLGSTAERVVRYAPCPVLTVPTRTTPKRKGNTPPLKIKKILVPIDFSEISTDALPPAAFLAERLGAELILAHIVENFPIDYLLGSELMNQTITPLMKQAAADLDRIARRLSDSTGLNVSVIVRDGTPFREICEVARKLGVDLVVLTTRGYTGLKHVWLGSTAERVVRHAHCPVLAVRELSRARV